MKWTRKQKTSTFIATLGGPRAPNPPIPSTAKSSEPGGAVRVEEFPFWLAENVHRKLGKSLNLLKLILRRSTFRGQAGIGRKRPLQTNTPSTFRIVRKTA